MTKHASASPPPSVAWLGYGGLLPFLALPGLIPLDSHHALLWSDALVTYGAVILSFVGAVHWGFAMALQDLTEQQRCACFAWSTVPALIAWPAMLLMPPIASALLIAGFVTHYVQDRRLAALACLPGWYLPLRLRLSSVACLSLAVGAYFISH